MTVPERINALRAQMKQAGIDLYLIPTDDDHQSEYVGEHDKVREYITGFTGSAGTAVITQQEAGLWTDGRYFIQAEDQLSGSGITLYKMGEEGVPTLLEYVKAHLPEKGTLAFDGRVVSMNLGLRLEKIASVRGASVSCGRDLVDAIWKDRPPVSDHDAFALPVQYTGETRADKLKRVRASMKEAGANIHLIASLDDICWLINVRGSDIDYSPLLLCFALVTEKDMGLYVDAGKISDDLLSSLEEDEISIRPYEAIYDDIRDLTPSDTILLDASRVNYALFHSIPKGVHMVRRENPEVLMKSQKNEVEIKNLKNAHIKDGVAVTKFMYWMKENVGKTDITEVSAARKLEEFRRQEDGYMYQSFPPICAAKEHGAIVHYEADDKTDIPVENDTLFLTDTGGNYMEGSTDVTRTFALGHLTREMKEDYTTVLLGNLRLARTKFPHGTAGYHLDAIARAPLWEKGLNFNHGTGHGVGYLLSVHEDPCRFSPSVTPGAHNALECGMVITDEPGVYREGKYGVRIENELLVCSGMQTEYGQFLYFEPLTLVPIDLEGILPELLNEEDKAQLNAYHQNVYKILSPYLTDKEREWLETYTRPIE